MKRLHLFGNAVACRVVRWGGLIGATLLGFAGLPPVDGAPPSAAGIEYFERKIRPLLSEHCYGCHAEDAETIHGGLRLDSPVALAAGGDSGPVVVPGDPASSLLIETVTYGGEIQMPPAGKLPAPVIAELTNWVARGAPFPPSSDPSPRAAAGIDFEAGRQFWSFQPVQRRSLPQVERAGWPRRRLDWFILAALEQQRLQPAPEADRATLIRRLSFDLIGLPPTPEEVRTFVENDDPRAYEKLVDRLLHSPHYGEKWGRMWLDLARYTDRTASWLYENGKPHLYRDWVVEAFNRDMPYDDFVQRQLATDMMAQTGPADLPALGFLGLSPSYWKELKLPCEIIKVIVADEWEERVDAVSRTFLGLTVACARCHDHKFDPISTEDYYALAGVFASCRLKERPLIPESDFAAVQAARDKVAALQAKLEKLQSAKPTEQADESGDDPEATQARLAAEIEAIQSSVPHYDVAMASAVVDEAVHVVRAGERPEQGTRLEHRAEPRDLPVFIRGNPNRPAEVVPRGFLRVLSETPQSFQQGSGRLELAHAITRDARGLAARVLVNRVWLEHFGRGLVATPSNFGQQGSRPTHPALLDDLAARVIAEEWSIKELHREIVLSATWRQACLNDPSQAERDPENRWYARGELRRLPFESWRDAMLVATGGLDRTLGGASLPLEDPQNHRRTVYATVHRREMSTTLQIHDFPDPTAHSPQRSQTITALQGLFALNGPLVAEQANALVRRLERECGQDDAARIERAYQLLFQRSPQPREQSWGEAFLADQRMMDRDAGWRQYAQMLLISNEFLFVD